MLRAGDVFTYRGRTYEKISGNYADLIVKGEVVSTVEFGATVRVTVNPFGVQES